MENLIDFIEKLLSPPEDLNILNKLNLPVIGFSRNKLGRKFAAVNVVHTYVF